MIPNRMVKYVTSNFCNFFITKKNLQIISSKIIISNFGTTNALYDKKKKINKKRWFWKDKEDDFKIIKPRNYVNRPSPILDPVCKVAVIVGGSKGFGFAAADELLSKGAKNVVIADNDNKSGNRAVQRLCDFYGRDRASLIYCDIRDPVQFEGVFAEVLCRHKEVHILFSDLDQNQSPRTSSICTNTEDAWSNTRKASIIGLKYIGTDNGGPGGIIINCASILGFMGWPQNPTPVYCKKEPVIEVTMSIAEEHSLEKSGVRFVALCPTNKQFEKISLPDFPEIQDLRECVTKCTPLKKTAIGPALTHVMACASTGSTWLVPPYPKLRDLPQLIHFPKNPDELVDPKVYEQKPCPVVMEPQCVKISENSRSSGSIKNCDMSCAKPNCKPIFSKNTK